MKGRLILLVLLASLAVGACGSTPRAMREFNSMALADYLVTHAAPDATPEMRVKIFDDIKRDCTGSAKRVYSAMFLLIRAASEKEGQQLIEAYRTACPTRTDFIEAAIARGCLLPDFCWPADEKNW